MDWGVISVVYSGRQDSRQCHDTSWEDRISISVGKIVESHDGVKRDCETLLLRGLARPWKVPRWAKKGAVDQGVMSHNQLETDSLRAHALNSILGVLSRGARLCIFFPVFQDPIRSFGVP